MFVKRVTLYFWQVSRNTADIIYTLEMTEGRTYNEQGLRRLLTKLRNE